MKKTLLVLFVLTQLALYVTAQELKYTRIPTSTSYVPLKIEGNIITLSGKKIELAKNGFPKQIQTFLNPEGTAYTTSPTNLLYENIHFHFVRKDNGKNIVLKDGGIQFLKKSGKGIKWKSTNQNDSLVMEVNATLGSNGFMVYKIKVLAFQAVELKDVTMHIPFIPTVPNNMMGFGIEDGKRPEKVEWKWDGEDKDQNGAWLGSVNTGLQYTLLKGAWSNKTKGGVTIGIKGSSMLANNYTGEHKMEKGDVLHYDFTLLITPFQAFEKK